MVERPLVCGVLFTRNHRATIETVLAWLRQVCEVVVVCDEASDDGTYEVLKTRGEAEPHWLPSLLRVGPEDFRPDDPMQCLLWRQVLLVRAEEIQPLWLLWVYGDEVMKVTPDRFRMFLRQVLVPHQLWTFHGVSDDRLPPVRLWRWQPKLTASWAEERIRAGDAIGLAPFWASTAGSR